MTKNQIIAEKDGSLTINVNAGEVTVNKDLTDDEIEEFAYAFMLWQQHNPDKALEGIMDFARAILRKAQEK
jgi:hypothetical protein